MKRIPIYVSIRKKNDFVPMLEVKFRSSDLEAKDVLISASVNIIDNAQKFEGYPLTSYSDDEKNDMVIETTVILIFQNDEKMDSFLEEMKA